MQNFNCDTDLGSLLHTMDNGNGLDELEITVGGEFRLIRMPDGIVTGYLDGERYRGACYFQGDEPVVTACGLRESSANMSVLQGERGEATLDLAKLVLNDMVRGATDDALQNQGLSLQGSTTQIRRDGSTTHFGFQPVHCLFFRPSLAGPVYFRSSDSSL